MAKEKRIQTAIVKRIRERGGFAVVTTCPPCDAGTPDILGGYRGVLLGVEVKASAREKPTEIQKYRGEQIRDAGGVWLVAWSVEQVDGLLDWVESGGMQ